LAFAFASCSSSSGSGGDEPGPGPTGPTEPTEPTTPVLPPRYVEKIIVMKHPTAYSFEAAAPDLVGLKVAVYWNDSGARSVEIVDIESMESEDAKRFYTEPPVTYLFTGGTNIEKNKGKYGSSGTNITVMNKLDYQLHYNYFDDGIVTVQPVPLYIPAVRALAVEGGASTGSFNTAIQLTGNIPMIFEDQPLDATGVKIMGNYVDMPGGPGWRKDDGTLRDSVGTSTFPYAERYLLNLDTDDDGIPDTLVDPNAPGSDANAKLVGKYFEDTGREWKEYAWAGDALSIKSVPISSNKKAWLIVRDKTVPSKSKLYYVPVKDPNFVETETGIPKETGPNAHTNFFRTYEAKVGAFYYVDKLAYKSGVERLRTFYADEEEMTGDKVDWVKELTAADIRFNVIYYTGPGQELPEASREIGMPEYISAMYKYEEFLTDVADTAWTRTPKATVPVVRGADLPVSQVDNLRQIPGGPSGKQYLPNSIIGAAILDFLDDATLACFYYYTGIEGDLGHGKYNHKNTLDTSGKGWANAASISLYGKIYIFDHIEAVRKPNTDANKNPEVLYQRTTGAEFLKALQTRWDVVAVYVDPNDSSKTLNSRPYSNPTTKLTNYEWDWRKAESGPSPFSPAFSNTAADPGETEEWDIVFDLPWSDPGTDEITFEYDVVP